MKNTGKCPKCGSTDMIRIPRNSLFRELGNNIRTGFFATSAVCPARFLCGNCGFLEDWVEAKSDIEKIRKKFGE
jgi:predicted nucleic-acid-binding Zn-ribbon protein